MPESRIHCIVTEDLDKTKEVVYYCTPDIRLGAFSPRTIVAFYDKKENSELPRYTPMPEIRILGAVRQSGTGTSLITPSYTHDLSSLTPELINFSTLIPGHHNTEPWHLVLLSDSSVWMDYLAVTQYTEQLSEEQRTAARQCGLERFL
ncbi:MAG: hypothetical protein Q7R96_03550 [Nanoarchaeota archaeon]|nr:hypothetical protein [Nanoarchaeota archaeon]